MISGSPSRLPQFTRKDSVSKAKGATKPIAQSGPGSCPPSPSRTPWPSRPSLPTATPEAGSRPRPACSPHPPGRGRLRGARTCPGSGLGGGGKRRGPRASPAAAAPRTALPSGPRRRRGGDAGPPHPHPGSQLRTPVRARGFIRRRASSPAAACRSPGHGAQPGAAG